MGYNPTLFFCLFSMKNYSSIPWLDYSSLETEPLKSIFDDALAEWLQNSAVVFGDDALEIWVEDILPSILQNLLNDTYLEEILLYLPNMLEALSKIPIQKIQDTTLEHTIKILLRKP